MICFMAEIQGDFTEWVRQKLSERGWDQAELSRQAKRKGYPIGTSQISRVLNGYSRAGEDFCKGIAHALDVPEPEVFKRAGIVSSGDKPLTSDEKAELNGLIDELTTSERGLLREIALTMYRQRVKSDRAGDGDEDDESGA